MAYEVKAPNPYHRERFSLFLGGAIDMNKERTFWQNKVVAALKDVEVTVLNPRRDEWDESWEEGSFELEQQILWEIAAQEAADLRVYVFTKNSKAPVTMFEAGAWGVRRDSIFCVEEGFYRQANLKIYSLHFKIPIYTNFEEFLTDLHTLLKEKIHQAGK